jgi:hypothetical protein
MFDVAVFHRVHWGFRHRFSRCQLFSGRVLPSLRAKACSEKGSNYMKKIAKTEKIRSLKNRESISQKLGVYAVELGMGIEPSEIVYF